MLPPFKVLSLSYKHAPCAVREQLALSEAARDHLLQQLFQQGLRDVLVLSTCNRTEVYYSADRDHSREIQAALAQGKGPGVVSACHPYFTHLTAAPEAIAHLFAVTLGLEAQVVGDRQICHQVKRAYQRSVALGAAGPVLHHLLQTTLAANKRVQQETPFRDGAASCSYATLELVQELTAHLAQPRVLIVGLGEIGADVGRHFGKSPRFAHVTVCNRTHETATALAAEYGLQVLDFAALASGLREADVIISSMAPPVPFFTPELVAAAAIRPQFYIDLSLPRSVAAGVAQVPGVGVYNIDAIQSRASVALTRRLAAVPQVQAIIADSIASLHLWSQDRQLSHPIRQLKSTLEALCEQEISRRQKQMSAREAALVHEVTRSLTQQFLKLPVRQLKAAGRRGQGDQLGGALTELFCLEGAVAAGADSSPLVSERPRAAALPVVSS